MKLINGFSPSMLGVGGGTVEFKEISLLEAHHLANRDSIESAVGHRSTAKIFSELLGIEVKPRRVQVRMSNGETALLGSMGTRVPEGRTLSYSELQKMPIRWFLVKVIKEVSL
jgi:hypothetical protein